MRTERLTLTRLVPGDIDALAEMLADPVVMAHFPRPMTRLEAEAWLRRNAERYEQYGTGLFAVRCGSAWIGDCGLIARRIDHEQGLELGYHFQRRAWGHGYATEAAAACVDLAFRATDVPRLTALIRPENCRSRLVATRLGFRVAGTVLHMGAAHERWVLPRNVSVGATTALAPPI